MHVIFQSEVSDVAALVVFGDACLQVGLLRFLQPARDEEVKDGDDVALVGRHRAPQPLHAGRERPRVLPRQVVHAAQQLLAPVACARTRPSASYAFVTR